MKKLIFLLVSLLIPNSLICQDSAAVHKLNSMYLLLGTLSDYMGRYTYINKPGQVDEYHYYEQPLVEFIDSLINNDLGFESEVSQTSFNGNYYIFSDPLAKSIRSRYENNLLIDSLFRTNQEICSFLAGRYYRYGEQLNDSIYKIHIPNSPDHSIIEVLLRRINCRKIHYKFLRNIPGHFSYFFIPTDELKKSFAQVSRQKYELSLSYKKAAVRLLGLNNEYEKQVQLKNARDLREMIRLFSDESSGMILRDSSLADPN